MVDGGADVQIDRGGFVRIHYAILEQLAAGDFSSREYACVLYLLRMTYGFNRKACELSYSDFAKATNIDRTAAIKTLKGLVARRVVTKTEGENNHAATWAFNKYFEQWTAQTSVKTTTSDETTTSQIDTSSSVETTTSLVVETTTSYISAKDNSIHISKDTQGAQAQGDYFGMPDPRRPSTASQHTTDAKREGVNAETFRLITDTLIDACGWRAMVDGGQNGRKLLEAKDAALELVRMGHTTVEQVTALVAAFRAANTWRNAPPKPSDFVTYASQVKAGIAPTGKPATNGNGKPDGRLSINDPGIQEARAKAERERIRTQKILDKLQPVKAERIAR